jgi:subtilisin-like proprotein convertase family protein
MKRLLFISFIILLSFPVLTNAQYYYNRAFNFSGATGTYAVTDPGTNLSITGSFTVECWVNPVNVASPSAQILIQKRAGSAASGYTLYLSAGKVCIRTNSTTRLTGTTVIPNGAWTHVAATYNTSTNVFTVYVNGVADGTVTTASAAPAADADSLRFAAGFNSPFAGLMDEIRVWNIEVLAADLLARMRLPLGESSGIYTGLVGAWRGNNPAGGSGVEEINGYTAYLRGAATFLLVGDKPGGCTAFNTGVKFSGATGTYIAAPHTSALDITGSFTLECWVNPVNVATPSFQILIQKRNGSAAAGYTMYLSSGKVCVRTNSTSRLTGTTAIPNGVWSHVAATYNSSTNVFTVYVNGVADGTVTTASAAPATDTDSLRLAAGFNSPYAGLMDEVRISNYSKTTDELQKYMFVSIDQNNEPNPSNTNISYSFEGILQGTDGSSRGSFRGDAVFSKVFNNSAEFPSPLDRYDAGYFANGFKTKYCNLTFGTAPTTITDSIFMSQSLTISDVNVFIAATHTYASDISVSLKNPAGTTTRILYPGGSSNLGMHMITIFDDQADSLIGNTITAPFSPRVKPTNALSVFNSQNSLGWWKIIITDIYTASDNGTLVGWGIQFNNQIITGSENISTNTPGRFYLHQNYPNPFNPVTKIKYEVAKNVNVKIMVYDILGKEVMLLVNGNKKAGVYEVEMNAVNLSSGVYFYKIQAGEFTNVKKMILLK